jgi:hypothetical protein
MTTKYGKNVTTLNNVKKLVKTLLVLADGENPVPNNGLQVIFDEEENDVSVSGDKLQVIVCLKWITENQLQISGKVPQKPNNKLVPKGVKKSDLLTLLEYSGEKLELPPPKTREETTFEQDRRNQALQGILDCLRDLEILNDEKSTNKNQGYWIFCLTLHQTKLIPDNLKYIENKFKDELPSANTDTVRPVTKPDSDREKPDNTEKILQGQQQIIDFINSKTTENPDLKLYKALLKLDYSKQQSLFEEFVNHHQIGACLIHGSAECGPRWLMNRLIQQVPNGGPDKYVRKISFSRTTQNGSLDSICKEISRKIGISSTAIPEMAQKICQLWRSQTVILIFDNTHNLEEAYLENFLEKFWQPIADLAKQTGTINYNYRLVLFLLDLEGYTNDWEIPYTQEITPEWHPRTLIKFKEIEPISPVELSGWLEQHLCDKNLPPKSEIVEELLETSQGNHQYIMEELCQRCNITWEEQESKWLKY